MARDVLMERRVAQAGTLQARITTVECGHRGVERSTHPTPQGVARGEQLLYTLASRSSGLCYTPLH